MRRFQLQFLDSIFDDNHFNGNFNIEWSTKSRREEKRV